MTNPDGAPGDDELVEKNPRHKKRVVATCMTNPDGAPGGDELVEKNPRHKKRVVATCWRIIFGSTLTHG